MKKLLMFSLLLAWAVPASATVYTDSTGDLGGYASGFPHMDIASVEVTNTATDVTFAVNLVGDISTATGADWAKYIITIDSVPGGDTVKNAPDWSRNLYMPSGMDYFVGSWADSGGGAQLYNYDGANWNGPAGVSTSLNQFSISFTMPLADIGVSLGGSFDFDVFTTGETAGSGGLGGDAGTDSLGNAGVASDDWGGGSFGATEALPVTYVTPEPATLGLLAIGGVLALRRRRS